MVTQQGFNALLKLRQEEPPPHLKFIFATTEPEKVIPTIRSRTHHYPFRLVPPSVLRELMQDILRKEGVAVQDSVLPLVVRAGAGSVRDSLSILDQLLAGSDETGLSYDRAVALLGFTDASLLDEIADAFAAGDGAAAFHVVNRVIEGGYEPRRFAADMLDRFRDLIVLAAVPDAADIGLLDLPPDRAELMAAQAGRFGQAGLTRAADIISQGLDQMRGATSPRLLLELMCAQVLLPAADTDEKSLLARIERLERGTPSPLPAVPQRAPHAGKDHFPERTVVSAPAERPSSGRAAAERPAPGVPQRSAPAPAGTREPAPARPAPDRPAAPERSATERPADAESAAGQPASGRSAPARPAEAESAPGQPAAGRSAPGRSAEAQRSPGQPAPARSAPGRPAESAPGGPAAAPSASGQPAPANSAPAASAPAGGSPGDALRRNWEAVLEAVKRERRVAWMLLSHTSVVSVEDGILTLRFARDGDLKGFAASGHDAVLKRVLADGFGLNVTVKGVVGGDTGAPSGATGPEQAAGYGQAARHGQGAGYGQATGHGHGQPTGHGQAAGPGQATGPGQAAGTGRAAARPGTGGRPSGSAEPVARGAQAPERPLSDLPPPDWAAYDDEPADEPDEEMPQNGTPAGRSPSVPAELTGVDLIQRELGGQVIGEIDG